MWKDFHEKGKFRQDVGSFPTLEIYSVQIGENDFLENAKP